MPAPIRQVWSAAVILRILTFARAALQGIGRPTRGSTALPSRRGGENFQASQAAVARMQAARGNTETARWRYFLLRLFFGMKIQL